MQQVDTELLPDDAEGIAKAAALLQAGEIVALPTETVYGLAANALDPAAVLRIYDAKGRPSDNPLIVHVTGSAQAAQLATKIPPLAVALMEAFWPGPLTIVLPKNPEIPNITTGGRSDVGLRAPNHPAFQAVLAASGLALAAPSANYAGRPSPTTAAHVLRDMDGRIPAILDGGAATVGVESTVVALTGPTPVLLRPGGISLEQLQEVLGAVHVDPAVTEAFDPSRSPASPGMKYQHYAPSTPITLLDGSTAAQRAWVLAQAETTPVGVLCFDDDAAEFSFAPTVKFGARDDAAAQARQLFGALHQVDGLGVDQVYAQLPSDTSGVSLAVRNRLIKAAGHRVFTVPEIPS